MGETSRNPGETEKFSLHPDVVKRAREMSDHDWKVLITPQEMINRMIRIDRALNSASNDQEHSALIDIRDWLSEIFEDSTRRRRLE